MQLQRLIQTRKARGVSQASLALRMKTTQPALARLEGSTHDPRLSTLERYARALEEELRASGAISSEDLTVDRIEELIGAAWANSLRLASDARLLLDQGRLATAYAIAEVACEEAGKILMLTAAGTDLAIGRPVDWKELRRRLTDHASKIRTLMQFDWAINDQEAAWRSGDLDALLQDGAGRRKAASEAAEALVLRERALYVEVGPLGISTPETSVRPEDAKMMVEGIEAMLTQMHGVGAVPRPGALRQLARDPDRRKQAVRLGRVLNRLPAVIPFEDGVKS